MLINIRSSLLVGIEWSVYISKLRKFYASHFLGRILDCIYTICQHGEILISCTVPSGLPFPHSRACLVFLLYKGVAFAYYVINCFIPCYSVANNLFLLSKNCLLWHHFELILKRFSSPFQVSSSQTCPNHLICNFFVCHLKYPYSCFTSHFC